MPIVYLVDSAGARITDQVAMFPGRRHADASSIWVWHGTRASGLRSIWAFSGGAYIPAFCDLLIKVGNVSMYLDRHGWPGWSVSR